MPTAHPRAGAGADTVDDEPKPDIGRPLLRERGGPATRRQPPVPRIIHQFWDSPDIPRDVVRRMASWPAEHPAWAYMRWSDDSAADLIGVHFGAEAERRFRACGVPAMRADVLRIAALLLFGGIYLDADTTFRGKLEPLLDAPCTLARNDRPDGSWRVQTHLIASAPGHPLLERFWRALMKNIAKVEEMSWAKLRVRRRTSNNVANITGPIALLAVLEKLPPQERETVRLLPMEDVQSLLRQTRNLSYVRRDGTWKAKRGSEPIVRLRSGEIGRPEPEEA